MISCSKGCKWSGLNRAHCATCHETFGSVQYFDRHRAYGACCEPSEVKVGTRALRRNDRGVWVIPYT